MPRKTTPRARVDALTSRLHGRSITVPSVATLLEPRGDLHVMLVLAALADPDGWCRASLDDMAGVLGVSLGWTTRALRRLSAAGYVDVRPAKGPKRKPRRPRWDVLAARQ